MSQSSDRRIYLSDLLMAVLFCGLVVATFTSPWYVRDLDVTFLAAGAVGAIWYYLRYIRSAPVCEECGAQFYPAKNAARRTHCPHCGRAQAPLRDATVRRDVIFCLIGLLIAIFTMAMFTFALAHSQGDDLLAPSRLAALMVATASAVSCGLAMVWLLRTPSPQVQPAEQICNGCGKQIPATPAPPSICPNCHSRKLTRDQFKTEHRQGKRSTAIALAIVAIFAALTLFWFIPSLFRSGNWLGLLVLGPLSLYSLFYAWKLIRFLIRSRGIGDLIGEEAMLAKARACAGEEGTLVKDGSPTIWYSGPDDPTTMLREENAAAHRRFTAMLGEIDVPDPPRSILCFHNRDALSKLHKILFPDFDLSAQLGICLQRPWNVMTLCTSPVAGRIDDPQSIAGSLYTTVLIEQVYDQLPAPWLQGGINRAIAADRFRSHLVALNRRMLAGRAEGIEWSEELFTTSASEMSKQLLRTNDSLRCRARIKSSARIADRSNLSGPDGKVDDFIFARLLSIRRSEHFIDQAWSVVEFLVGKHAPETRKASFRAFLKDKQATRRHEEAFFKHFGFGFGSLLDAWREWVTEQGVGSDEPIDPRTRDALVNRILPVIRDREAPAHDRIQAIRNWRIAGAELGALALIDLLREPGDIPKDELIRALRAVSGMPWGDDPDRWQAWSDNLSLPVESPST
jgi:predicted RNA-binding Zn-ribbon protein involved in translation (DUF1610 family)